MNEEGTLVKEKLTKEKKTKLKKEEARGFKDLKDTLEKGRSILQEKGEHIHFVKDGSSYKHCHHEEELKVKAEKGPLSHEEEEEYKKKRLHKALIQSQ